MSEAGQRDSPTEATLELGAASGRASTLDSAGAEIGDAELIAAYRAGNLAAYGELARRYQIQLFRLLLGVLADEDLAEHACEQVFVVANRRLDQLSESDSVYRWLLGIAREVARELLDSRAPIDASAARNDDAPRERLKHEVHAILQQLDPDLRLALVLVEFRGAEADEVAAALGCEASAVPEIVASAREAFAVALKRREAAPRTMFDSGHADAERLRLASGDVVAGRYEIDSLLGAGGMGVVYRARSLDDGTEVALKTMLPSRTASVMAQRRFEREAEAIGRLDHDSFVRILDYGCTPDAMRYMVMEYLRGRPLSDLVGETWLPPRRALEVIRELVAGLAHAHAAGVIHRDLKPENVMLVPSEDPSEKQVERAKILDLGLAKLLGVDEADGDGETQTRLTREGAVFGTPAYMAPEQALGHEVDARVDLYAVSVMLFELLTGRLPFMSSNPSAMLVKHVSQPVPRLAVIAPHLAGYDELQALIDAGLSKRPAERLPDAAAYLERVDALLATELPTPDGPFDPSGRFAEPVDRTVVLTSMLSEEPDPPAKVSEATGPRRVPTAVVITIVATIVFLLALWGLGVWG